MDDYIELDSELAVKTYAENRMIGSFKLYSPAVDERQALLVVKQKDNDDKNAFLSVRTEHEADKAAWLHIKYRGNDDLCGILTAIPSSEVKAVLEIRPHNRMFGSFELLEAPRKLVGLTAIADATTRSREDLQTINYGDTKSMLIGRNRDESFESFVRFANLDEVIPDILFIERAVLRLYYIELPPDSMLEIHHPNQLWREMGITHANKPLSDELLSDQFIINTRERYIEFDVAEAARRWRSGELFNSGFLVRTPDNRTISFYTRESDLPPQLRVSYVTSQVYSIGRETIDATMFIHGKGKKDINALLTVHSDVGFAFREASLYVHRKEDPMDSDHPAYMSVSCPDLHGVIMIQRRTCAELESEISVRYKGDDRYNPEAVIGASRPHLNAILTVDPRMSMPSVITIKQSDDSYRKAEMTVSKPDLSSFLTVSNYKRDNASLEALFAARTHHEDPKEAVLTVNKPELIGHFAAKALGEACMAGTLYVPYYEDKEAVLTISRPEMNAVMTVKYINEREGILWVKERSLLPALLDVKIKNDLTATLLVKQIFELQSDIVISRPDVAAIIQPRVTGIEDLSVVAQIRKRDAADLHSLMSVNGVGNKGYAFIM